MTNTDEQFTTAAQGANNNEADTTPLGTQGFSLTYDQRACPGNWFRCFWNDTWNINETILEIIHFVFLYFHELFGFYILTNTITMNKKKGICYAFNLLGIRE